MSLEKEPKLTRQQWRRIKRKGVEERKFSPPIYDLKEANKAIAHAARQLGVQHSHSEQMRFASLAQALRSVQEGSADDKAMQRIMLILQTMVQSENPHYRESASLILSNLDTDVLVVSAKTDPSVVGPRTAVFQKPLTDSVQIHLIINSRYALSHESVQTFAADITRGAQYTEELLAFHGSVDPLLSPHDRIELHAALHGSREELIASSARAEARGAQALIYQAALGWNGRIPHDDLLMAANFAHYGSDPAAEGWRAYVAPTVTSGKI